MNPYVNPVLCCSTDGDLKQRRKDEEDADAIIANTMDASDSDLSCVSEADSSTSRRHKLNKLNCNIRLGQM